MEQPVEFYPLSKSAAKQSVNNLVEVANGLEAAKDYGKAVMVLRSAVQVCRNEKQKLFLLAKISRIHQLESASTVTAYRHRTACHLKQILQRFDKFYEIRPVGKALDWMRSIGFGEEAEKFREAALHASVVDNPILSYKERGEIEEAAMGLTVVRVIHWLKLDPPDMEPLHSMRGIHQDRRT